MFAVSCHRLFQGSITPASQVAAPIRILPLDIRGTGLRNDAGVFLLPVWAALIGAWGCGCLATASPEFP